MNEFLYVVEFDSGVTKVGRGTNAANRIKAAENIGCIAGWLKTKEFSVQCVGGAGKPENKLIAFASSISKEVRNREWFVGADFDSLTNAATEFASKEYASSQKKTPEQFVNDLIQIFNKKDESLAIEKEKLEHCVKMAEELHEIASGGGSVSLKDDDCGFNWPGDGYKAAYALYFYLTNDIDALEQCRKVDEDSEKTINTEAVFTHFYWLVGEKGLDLNGKNKPVWETMQFLCNKLKKD